MCSGFYLSSTEKMFDQWRQKTCLPNSQKILHHIIPKSGTILPNNQNKKLFTCRGDLNNGLVQYLCNGDVSSIQMYFLFRPWKSNFMTLICSLIKVKLHRGSKYWTYPVFKRPKAMCFVFGPAHAFAWSKTMKNASQIMKNILIVFDHANACTSMHWLV